MPTTLTHIIIPVDFSPNPTLALKEARPGWSPLNVL
jgi:hypothetical protein